MLPPWRSATSSRSVAWPAETGYCDHTIENSHRPTRRRERALQRFKSPAHAQQVLAPFGAISDHFRPRRHRLPAPQYHQTMQTRFAAWREVTGLAAAA